VKGTRLADAMVECDWLFLTGVPHMPVRRPPPARNTGALAPSRARRSEKPEDVLSPAERRSFRRGIAQIERGEFITLDELRRGLGGEAVPRGQEGRGPRPSPRSSPVARRAG